MPCGTCAASQLSVSAREQMGRPFRIRTRQNTQRDDTCGLEVVCVRVGCASVSALLLARVLSISAACALRTAIVCQGLKTNARAPRVHTAAASNTQDCPVPTSPQRARPRSVSLHHNLRYSTEYSGTRIRACEIFGRNFWAPGFAN